MAIKQETFCTGFKKAFEESFGKIEWIEGQCNSNRASLPPVPWLRRNQKGKRRTGGAEAFELGDLRAEVGGYTVIVEFESDWVSVHNLVKYWPFIRGELSIRPSIPILLCHFSNWASYGSYRDLWKWLYDQIRVDPGLIVSFRAEQFDSDSASVAAAIEWLELMLKTTQSAPQ